MTVAQAAIGQVDLVAVVEEALCENVVAAADFKDEAAQVRPDRVIDPFPEIGHGGEQVGRRVARYVDVHLRSAEPLARRRGKCGRCHEPLPRFACRTRHPVETASGDGPYRGRRIAKGVGRSNSKYGGW